MDEIKIIEPIKTGNQRTQYAAVQSIYPALIIMFRMPGTHDIVTILIELQVKSDGIVRTATKTVISLMVAPRVYNLFHILSAISISSSILSTIKSAPAS